ncbi:MAG: hypothetical protein JW816_03000 [Candidatus Buchananbacteria bacterium]|nr:hypothetical protein [Candidatus Buchananbacteria bacterium]
MLERWKSIEDNIKSREVDYRETDEDYAFFIKITDNGDTFFCTGNSENNKSGELITWVNSDPKIKRKLEENKIDIGFYPAYFTIEPNPGGNSWKMRVRLKNDESINWELNIDKLAVWFLQENRLVEEGTVDEKEVDQITDEMLRENDDDEKDEDESDDTK